MVYGLLVEPDDVEGLADALLRLLGDPVAARVRAGRGYDRIAQAFSAERMVTEYERCYEPGRLVSRRP